MSGSEPWLAALGAEDRARFSAEVQEALLAAQITDDASPLEACLREWRWTAEALADPVVRAALTAPGDDDYTEVPRP